MLNAVRDLDEIVGRKLPLEDLQDRLQLLSAHVQLIGDVLDTSPLEEAGFISRDHVFEALHVLGVTLLLGFLHLLMKFANFRVRLLLVCLKVALGATATSLAKNKKFKQIVDDFNFCGGSLASIRLRRGDIFNGRLLCD